MGKTRICNYCWKTDTTRLVKDLLAAMMLPSKIAIVKRAAHSRAESEVAREII